jgi:hypothetical protein
VSRERPLNSLRVGDVVVRRNRLFKTQGTVVRFGEIDARGGMRAWIKWHHPDTLPNPSLEPVDDLERCANLGSGAA